MSEGFGSAFARTYARYRWSFLLSALGTGLWMPLNAVFLVDERGLSASELALYYFVLAAGAIVANVLVSPHVDGRRVYGVFVTAGAFQMLGVLGLLLPGPFGEVAAAGVLSGLGNGLFFASQGVILLRIFGREALSAVYGRQYRMVNLYMALGAMVLAVLVQTVSRTGYLIAFSVNAVSYLIHVLNVAGPVRRAGLTSNPAAPTAGKAAAVGRLRPYTDPHFRYLLVVQAVVVAVGLSQLSSAVPVLFRTAADAPVWVVTMLLIVNTAVVVAAQGRAVAAVRAHGERRALRTALALWTVAVLPAAICTLVTVGLWATAVCVALYGAVFALAETWVSPSIQPLVAKLAPPEQVGAYSAATSLMYSLGLLVGPPVGLFVFGHLGVPGYWVFIVLGLLAGQYALTRLRTARQPEAGAGEQQVAAAGRS